MMKRDECFRVLARHVTDEVIVSTLPKGISRWLGEDVPSRLHEAITIPITVVTQAES